MRRPLVHAAVAVSCGIVHAVVVVGVALRYGYDVGPGAYAPATAVWLYGGLVLLGALVVWLALEHRLVLPLALVAALVGFALYAELTPPGPTFRDVAELEPSVDGPTGITVVEDGLYLVKYTSGWVAWSAAAALAGLWEFVVRRRQDWLPAPRTGSFVPAGRRRLPARWRSPPERDSAGAPGPTTRSTVPIAVAVAAAIAAGVVHAVGSVGFAAWSGFDAGTAVWLWATAGAVLLLAVPVFLHLLYDLATPTAAAILLFVNSVHRQLYAAGPGDPHGLYLGAWFLFLAIALLPGAIEALARYAIDELGPATDGL